MPSYLNGLFDHIQNGQTALHYAAMLGEEETVKVLLQNGANVNAQNKVSAFVG